MARGLVNKSPGGGRLQAGGRWPEQQGHRPSGGRGEQVGCLHKGVAACLGGVGAATDDGGASHGHFGMVRAAVQRLQGEDVHGLCVGVQACGGQFAWVSV